MRAAGGLVAILAAACGYAPMTTPRIAAVDLAIVDNRSDRRLHEFDLAPVLARALENQGVRLNVPGATHELRGEILRIDEPRLVEGRLDQLRVGGFRVTLEMTLVEKATGRVVWNRRRTETAATAPERGRTAEMARQEVFDRLAQWTARQFEPPW